MAVFSISEKRTGSVEGGWQNNPNDRGNLPGLGTYKGIASKHSERWPGWTIIKAQLASMLPQPKYGTPEYRNWVKCLDSVLEKNATLQRYVDDFIKKNHWDRNRLDEINDQDLADFLYDMSVNTWDDGNKAVQKAVGVKPDGAIGSVSIKAINEADPKKVLAMAREIMKAHYIQEAKKPGQKPHLNSWLARIGISGSERAAIIAAV